MRDNDWHRPSGEGASDDDDVVDDSQCPCCFASKNDAEDPMENPFSLACGHEYCLDCIQMQLSAAPLPFACGADGCGAHMAWNDVLNVTAKEEDAEGTLENIVKKSVRQALNEQMAKVCPGLDCDQIRPFSNTSKDQTFSCDQVRANPVSCRLLGCLVQCWARAHLVEWSWTFLSKARLRAFMIKL